MIVGMPAVMTRVSYDGYGRHLYFVLTSQAGARRTGTSMMAYRMW